MITYNTIKAQIDYFLYLLSYRLKFLISTVITILSLYIAFYTLGDALKDIWFWIGLFGTVSGGLLTFSELRDFRRDVNSLYISQQINHDIVKTIKGEEVFSKGGRYYLIDRQVNASIRKGSLRKPVCNIGKFTLHPEVATRSFIEPIIKLSYFRNGNFHSITHSKAKILVWNDKKVRLETNPVEFGLSETKEIRVKTTNYFDYIISAFFSLRKISRNGTVICDGIELMRKTTKDGKTELWSISETLTAHHIGVSVLLMDAENNIWGCPR